MKYFTPDLLARYRSDDEALARAAAEEWDCQCTRYAQHLQSIRPHLPKGMLPLNDSVHLHDAEVRWGPVQNDPSKFAVVALPEGAATGDLFVLLYQIKGPVEVKKPAQATSEGEEAPAEWLIDEIEIIDRGGLLFQFFHPKVFRHSILLSNGIELVIDFTDMIMMQTNVKTSAMPPKPVRVA